MKKKSIAISTLILSIGLLLSGCAIPSLKSKPPVSAAIETPKPATSDTVKPDYAGQFAAMVSEKKSSKDLILFLETNAKDMSQKDVDKAIMDVVGVLQNSYKTDREAFQKKQAQMMRTPQKNKEPQNTNPREALDKPYIEQGYFIHVNDASYHLDIDYGNLLNKFEKYISAQASGYLNIMDQDTKDLYSEEGRLQITFNQFAQRLIREETYINNFPDAPTTKDIRSVYNRSILDLLGGRGIDDIIDYHTQMLKHDAIESYKYISKTYPNSNLANILIEYQKVLEKNKYKKNYEVKKYIKSITGIDPDRPVDHEI